MAFETDEDPQAIAAESAIQDFRKEHEAALYDKGHVENERRTRELTALYERRFGAEPNQFDPVAGEDRPPTTLDQVAEEAMEVPTPDKYELGPASDFGINVDQRPVEEGGYGWDANLESEARSTFARAELNQGEARLAALCYAETLPATFDIEVNAKASTEALQFQYGENEFGKVVEATNRFLRAAAGPELYKFIGRSGLGSHPRFVSAAAELARKRGYF